MKQIFIANFQFICLLIFLCGHLVAADHENAPYSPSQLLPKVLINSNGSIELPCQQKLSLAEPLPTFLDGVLLKLHGIALFAGIDVVSCAIRQLTKSQWSHVGILLRDEAFHENDRSKWYCFEATGSAREIAVCHKLPSVKINFWNDILEKYDGKVAYRVLRCKVSVSSEHVMKLIKKFHGIPFERHPSELIMALKQKNQETDLASVFCSELVAECLQSLGLLEKDRLSNNFLPKDFSSETPLMLKNAELSEEIVVRKINDCTML